jgi:hypothetical protein
MACQIPIGDDDRVSKVACTRGGCQCFRSGRQRMCSEKLVGMSDQETEGPRRRCPVDLASGYSKELVVLELVASVDSHELKLAARGRRVAPGRVDAQDLFLGC